MSVHDDIDEILKQFHKNKKWLGLCCISPIIAARVFGKKFNGPGVTLTLGSDGKSWPYDGSMEVASSFGNNI